jgi:ABC-2 type transport system permease protein
VLFELVRASFLIIFSVVVFNIKIQGSLLLIALILAIYIIVSTTIGMIISSIVKTEQQFQAIAMLVSLPTMFLSGVFFPLQAMPKIMQSIANFLPITYAADALRGVMVKALPIQMISYPLSILLLFLVIFVTCVVLVFKRDIE